MGVPTAELQPLTVIYHAFSLSTRSKTWFLTVAHQLMYAEDSVFEVNFQLSSAQHHQQNHHLNIFSCVGR